MFSFTGRSYARLIGVSIVLIEGTLTSCSPWRGLKCVRGSQRNWNIDAHPGRVRTASKNVLPRNYT